MRAIIQYFPFGRWSDGTPSPAQIRIEINAFGGNWIYLPWTASSKLCAPWTPSSQPTLF